MLGPLDAFVRTIDGQQDLPPLHLRWEVGPLRGFVAAGAEFRLFLQLFGGMSPESHVLDIGCGCGQMALVLRDTLNSQGRYEGWDINLEAIRWCQKAIARIDARFSFRVLDVRNGLYNPKGQTDAAALKFPGSGPFDVILLKSVFTHMLAADVENYLSQIPGLLSEHGRCLATFFLLNERQRTLAADGISRITFHHDSEGVSVANPRVPEAIVAYEESFLMDMLRRAHLRKVQPALAGSWTGDTAGLSHQDILILERDV